MVDINLFKDEEDAEKDWSPGEGVDEEAGEDFSLADEDVLSLEDESTEPTSLDTDSILDDEDVLPDFEEPEVDHHEEDYEFGDVEEKKAPVWLWAVLGLVVICVFVYLFVIQPRQRGLTDTSSRLTGGAVIEAEEASTAAPMEETGVESDESAAGGQLDRPVPGMMDEAAEEAASIDAVVNSSNAILASLAESGRFGAVLITGDRFFVEYVSETARVSDRIGREIQDLVGAAEFAVSPEERHRRGDDVRYSGVVSGTLPAGGMATAGAGEAYRSTDEFIAAMRSLVNAHKLTVSQATRLSEIQEAAGKVGYVRLRVEGTRANTVDFLNALKDHRGAHGLSKLLLVPQSYTDYRASRLKIVLDYRVMTG